jgi:NAD(P)-dependent dehydrogenase (short-subunit alcohol dehydrogenase family)
VVIVEPGFFKTSIGDKTRERADTGSRRRSPYAKAYERMTRMLDLVERFAPSADVVARTIVSAIESRRPRQRYVVGLDALATIATQPFIPRELTDLAMRLVAGLPGR